MFAAAARAGDRGLEVGDGGGQGLGLEFVFGIGVAGVSDHAQKASGKAVVFGWFVVQGDGGEGAEYGVGFDLLDEFAHVFPVVPAPRFLAREVDGGDLEAVEEETGAAWIDGVGGDAAQDLGDGDLDAWAVFGERQVEGGLVCGLQGRRGAGLRVVWW